MTTYMVITALKVFDIVFVMGNAETNGTEVIAERMIRWYFINGNDGRAAAIAVDPLHRRDPDHALEHPPVP